MALAMTRPTRRPDSCQYQFKRRTPAGLAQLRGEKIVLNLPGHGPIQLTIGEVVKVSLRTTDANQAKLRSAVLEQQLLELEQVEDQLPMRLTFKQHVRRHDF